MDTFVIIGGTRVLGRGCVDYISKQYPDASIVFTGRKSEYEQKTQAAQKYAQFDTSQYKDQGFIAP